MHELIKKDRFLISYSFHRSGGDGYGFIHGHHGYGDMVMVLEPNYVCPAFCSRLPQATRN